MRFEKKLSQNVLTERHWYVITNLRKTKDGEYMGIVSIDVPRVRGKMAERGFTITSMSDRLGINRNTLSSYLESPEKMPYGIISGMADALCDTANEAATIFFAPDLRRTKVMAQDSA